MKLNTLPTVTENPKKRRGRGPGSGKGRHTSGRGMKGQGARKSKNVPLWFEGGALPLIKRLPFQRGKLRFSSLKAKPQLITLSQLERLTEKEVTPELLKKHKLIRKLDIPVKVTGVGEVKKAVTIVGIQVTASAKKAIEQAGGSVR